MPARADERAEPLEAGSHSLQASAPSAVWEHFPAPVASRIESLGLSGIALFLLDVCRPFGWLGAQAVLVAQPTLALFGADRTAAKLAAWLEQVANTPDKGSQP